MIDIEEEDPTKVAADLKLNLASVYTAKSRVLAKLKEMIQAVDEQADTVFLRKKS